MTGNLDRTDSALNFARHFSRLVWLLLKKPGDVDEQKAELRALVNVSGAGPVHLLLTGGILYANDRDVAPDSGGVDDVILQMTTHGLGAIIVDAKALPADLLGVARILASMPVLTDGGANAESKRLAIGATTLRFAARPRDSRELPSMPAPLLTSSIAPPPIGSQVLSAVPRPDVEQRTSDPMAVFDFGEVFDDPIAEARARATPRHVPTMPSPGEKSGERRTGLFAQFAAARVPAEPYDQLLARLEKSVDGEQIADLLDDLGVLCDGAAKEDRFAVVSEILFRVGRREAQVEGFETKRVFAMTLKALSRPQVLKAVVMQLPHATERREEHVAVLVRAGGEGADALVEQLATVSHASDRRIYLDVFRSLKAGVPRLVHMLSDTRWFVARTAAQLLGELQVPQAEQPLTESLKHEDERVRRAASTALMRLGTPRAMQAIDGALKDATAQTRMEAASALATRKDVRTAATLIRALDAEKEDDVRVAFLLALGKLRTPDAVRRLIQAAGAERGLFKKKTPTLRIGAIQGLGEARTMEAMDALHTLQNDKDAAVREAATYALGRIARTSGGTSSTIAP